MSASISDPPGIISPFQLFSAYSEADKDKFFGRDDETLALFESIQEANIVLVFGKSGTGKTSIVNCGLLNETRHFSWTSVTVRRGNDINASLKNELERSLGDIGPGTSSSVPELMHQVYLLSFQPILLVFDQFEEIFVFGSEQEREDLCKHIAEISAMRLSWKMIFVIREDFLAELEVFEKYLPGIFRKRMRVALVDRARCREIIVKSFERFDIQCVFSNPDKSADRSPDVADQIMDVVEAQIGEIHLPYFQVFLDRLWKEAGRDEQGRVMIDGALVGRIGGMGNVLKVFLEEQIAAQHSVTRTDAWKFLKLFVPEKGTTRKKVSLKEYTAIPEAVLESLVSYFISVKVLAGCSDGYELAHESLVPVIQAVKLNEIRPRLTEPTIKGNPYKGLASFDSMDQDRFYGRKEAITALSARITEHNFLVVVGNSGSGKSSLIKAGVFPVLKEQEYTLLPTIRSGEQPLRSIDRYRKQMAAAPGQYVIFFDQFEEVITRIRDKEDRDKICLALFNLLEEQREDTAGYKLKVVLTVRADFEPQFRIMKPLNTYWESGKYIVPPFTRDEIREVIEEPAYQAGLEFAPPSLAEAIADEVYNSQATGLLPLMSYTLSALYEKYKDSGREDNFLREEDYLQLGGVIGGLQNRAEEIYRSFEQKYTGYQQYQAMMQNILLRMIYLSTGELAGQRIYEEDILFDTENKNAIKKVVLEQLLESKLVISAANDMPGERGAFYEPAHDVLVRSWERIWDWIGQVGKDNIFLRSRVAQAVSDYECNNREQQFLWHNSPWLDNLVVEAVQPTSWLNQRELSFLQRSMEERELLEAQEKTKRDEQQKLIDEKIAAQEQTIKRERGFRVLIVIALAFALSVAGWAFYLMSEARGDRRSIQSLNDSLTDKNKGINYLNDSLKGKNDSLNTKELQLRIAQDSVIEQSNVLALTARRADSARAVAVRERLKATDALQRLAIQIGATETALKQAGINEIIATKARDSFREKNVALNRALEELSRKTQQNTAQTLELSAQQTDKGKAFRLAEIAYHQDPENKIAKERYEALLDQADYYPVRVEEGDNAAYLRQDAVVVNAASETGRIQVIVNGPGFPVKDSLRGLYGLDGLSAASGANAFVALFDRRVEIYQVADLHGRKRTVEVQGNLITATVSPDESKLLVLTDKRLQCYDIMGGTKTLFSQNLPTDLSILMARFSEDGKRILSNAADGSVSIWEATTGNMIPYDYPKGSITGTFISPRGSYFLFATSAGVSLYNSKGKKIGISDFTGKYGFLSAVIFSEDDKYLCMSFNAQSRSNEKLRDNKPVGKKYNSLYTVVYLDLSRPGAYKDITEAVGPENIYYFFRNTHDIVLDKGSFFIPLEKGGVLQTNITNSAYKTLNGHTALVKNIAVSGNSILTTGEDNRTIIWQLSTPRKLITQGLLPELSGNERAALGISAQ